MQGLLDALMPQRAVNSPQPDQPMAPPQPSQDAQGPSLSDQWMGVLSNPNVQAGMMAMGNRMLMGSWGGFGTALGEGMSAGAEVVGERQQLEQKQAEKEQARSDSLGEKATDNAFKERELASRERMNAANNDARLQAVQLRSSAKSIDEQKLYLTEKAKARSTLSNSIKGMQLDPVQLDEMAHNIAEQSLQASRSYRAPGAASAPGVATGNAPGPALNPATGGRGGPVPQANSPSQPNSANYPDGTVAPGPNGQSMIRRNGKWYYQ